MGRASSSGASAGSSLRHCRSGLRPLNIRRRLLGEPFDTRERAKPKRLFVEMEISSGTPRIHLHLTDGIDRVFARKAGDRKSTRLNSSHGSISYAVFCLKKKNIQEFNQNETL